MNAKNSRRPLQRRAFTLLELIIVIAIMVAMTGLIVGAMGPVKKRIARSQTETLIEVLKTGLEQYYAEFGVYPENSDLDRGGKVLYEILFGDYNNDGKPDSLGDPNSEIKTIVPQLRPPQMDEFGNPVGGNSMVSNARGFWEVVDPWEEPIFYINYRSGHPSAPNGGGKYNPGFDIWSTAGDEDPSDDNTSMWIKNW